MYEVKRNKADKDCEMFAPGGTEDIYCRSIKQAWFLFHPSFLLLLAQTPPSCVCMRVVVLFCSFELYANSVHILDMQSDLRVRRHSLQLGFNPAATHTLSRSPS